MYNLAIMSRRRTLLGNELPNFNEEAEEFDDEEEKRRRRPSGNPNVSIFVFIVFLLSINIKKIYIKVSTTIQLRLFEFKEDLRVDWEAKSKYSYFF